MTFSTLLEEVTAALSAAKIPFMLTGSLAAAAHGAGRATMDVDVVIDPGPTALDLFVRTMVDAGHYASADAARDALANRTMFNVVDVESGWKVDLIVRKHRAFSETEFARRREMLLGPVRLPVATIEDLMLAKLEWATLGGSTRQLDDVRALLRLAGSHLDRAYIEQWVAALGVGELWRQVNA